MGNCGRQGYSEEDLICHNFQDERKEKKEVGKKKEKELAENKGV